MDARWRCQGVGGQQWHVEVGVTGVVVDRLSSDEDEIVEVSVQCREGVEQRTAGEDVLGGRRAACLPRLLGACKRIPELFGLGITMAGQGEQVGERECQGRDLIGEHRSIFRHDDSVRCGRLGKHETHLVSQHAQVGRVEGEQAQRHHGRDALGQEPSSGGRGSDDAQITAGAGRSQ